MIRRARKKIGVIDFGFRKWSIWHYINTMISIVTFIMFYSNTIFNIAGFQINVSIGTILTSLIFVSIFCYSLGFYKNMDRKTYLKMMFFPLLVMLIEILLIWVSLRTFKIKIYYINYFKIILAYILGCISNFIFFQIFEYTVVYLDDKEVSKTYEI